MDHLMGIDVFDCNILLREEAISAFRVDPLFTSNWNEKRLFLRTSPEKLENLWRKTKKANILLGPGGRRPVALLGHLYSLAIELFPRIFQALDEIVCHGTTSRVLFRAWLVINLLWSLLAAIIQLQNTKYYKIRITDVTRWGVDNKRIMHQWACPACFKGGI